MHGYGRWGIQIHHQAFGFILARAGVRRLLRNVHAPEVMRDFLQWTLRRGQSDTLQAPAAQMLEPFQR